ERHKSIDELSSVGDWAQASAHVDFEPTLQGAVAEACFGDTPDVVKAGESAWFVGAPGECDLELASHVLGVGMNQQEVGYGVSVRADVEDFVSAYAGYLASRDVADGVAARFSRRDPYVGQTAHQMRGVFQVYV